MDVRRAECCTSSAAVTVDAPRRLGESAEAYSFLSYANRKAKSPQQFRHPARDEVVRAIFLDGYSPWQGTDEDDIGGGAWAEGRSQRVELGRQHELRQQYAGRLRLQLPEPDLRPQQPDGFLHRPSGSYTAWTNNADLKSAFEVGFLELAARVHYRRRVSA